MASKSNSEASSSAWSATGSITSIVIAPSVDVPSAARSTSALSRVRKRVIRSLVRQTASASFSGAGPPLAALNLMPKSPSGPPGLWLAERMIAPKALRLRTTQLAAGVERMPRPRGEHTADAVRRRHAQDRLDRAVVVEAAVAADDEGAARDLRASQSKIDCTKFSR
jgi:hypothetical protein